MILIFKAYLLLSFFTFFLFALNTDLAGKVSTSDPRLTDARIPKAHTHTKSEVGLGNVDNTADANKSVKYATSSGSANSATNASQLGGISSDGYIKNSSRTTALGYSDKADLVATVDGDYVYFPRSITSNHRITGMQFVNTSANGWMLRCKVLHDGSYYYYDFIPSGSGRWT